MPRRKHGKQAPKATKAQMSRRIADVIRWQQRGAGLPELIEQSKQPEKNHEGKPTGRPGWGSKLSESSIRRVISLANEYWQEYAEAVAFQSVGKTMARLDLLYAHSLQINDYKTALAVQQEINKVSGLHKLSIDVAGHPGCWSLENPTLEDLERTLERLERNKQDREGSGDAVALETETGKK